MGLNVTTLLILWLSYIAVCSCKNPVNESGQESSFGEIAKRESMLPIRPGRPGEYPFWNAYAKRFIYAPAFNYRPIRDVAKYRYKVFCESDSSSYGFISNVPYAPLSPIWTKMPVGYFSLEVIGISDNGDSIGLAGRGRYYHAAYFNGPYHKAIMPYDSSGMLALYHVLHKDYVTYWLEHKGPDPDYRFYRYPAKIYSALISGAVTYAQFKPHSEEGKRAVKLARTVANNLMKISFPEGSAWEYFPPTYYGPWIAKLKQASWIRLDNCQTTYGAHAGNAYLDLYDLTGDKKYFYAAERIADTYLKRQLKNGSWFTYVNPITGKPTYSEDNILIPALILTYLNRLYRDYGIQKLDTSIQNAFDWIMANPVKTFNWQAQFEDVGVHEPYKDLSKLQACEFAVYLFKNSVKDSSNLELAEEIVRYAEDQFVIWDKPRLLNMEPKPSLEWMRSTSWITPCVQEQYTYWMPVSGSAMMLIRVYRYAYGATGKKIYLAKAKSIANAMTQVQKIHGGNYQTYFTDKPIQKRNQWLNCVILPAEEMIRFGNKLRGGMP